MQIGGIIIFLAMIDVRLEGDIVWSTQRQMIALFGHDQWAISRHIRNIFNAKELDEKSNMHFLHVGRSDTGDGQ